MIRFYTPKSNYGWIVLATVLVLAGFMNLSPCLAEDDVVKLTQKETDAAVGAMQTWLKGIDAGNYAQSWTDASTSFHGVITSDKWVAGLNSVRAPLGKLKERKVVSAVYQTGFTSNDTVTPGQFVVAQFNLSFEDLKSARESVTFVKEADGTWRASGFSIKPL